MARKNDAGDKSRQRKSKHPEQWERDLKPNNKAGQNTGEARAEEVQNSLFASDLKELAERLDDFNLDELKQIPVLSRGIRLRQGATYVDLNDPERQPFVATDDMQASEESWIVPKSEIPPLYWNRLLGRHEPTRRQ